MRNEINPPLLFEKLNIGNGKVKKKSTNNYKTGSSELLKFENEHEIIPLILRYRKIQKLNSTYLEGIKPFIKSNGRIYTTFNQINTSTGRLSSSNPNLQSIPVRDDEGKELRYVVPEEGSNVWFEGWVMTKDADETLAGEFLNFLSRPDIAIRNMDYNGYTSCVGGMELFSYVKENFDEGEGEYFTDLKYFFNPDCTDDTYVIQTTDTYRHLYAQYADEETIARCAVMDNFSIEDLELVNEMWNKVKLITISDLGIILIVVAMVAVIGFACCVKWKDKLFSRNISQKERRVRPGLKIVSVKERER